MNRDRTPTVTATGFLDTALGRIGFEVYGEAAPSSCATFLHSLTTGGWDGARLLRVVRPDNDQGRPRIDVVQAQGHSPDPLAVPHESTDLTGLRHTAGTLSLARAEPGTANGDHVFFCVRDSPALDAGGARQADGLGFAAFGRVTDGLAILEEIQGAPCNQGDEGYSAGQILTDPVTIRRGVVVGSG